MSGVTDTIKERIDIAEFIGQFVPLKRVGRNYVGFCPFHTNTRTPAFTVYPESQSFHCFGCKASGTVFDFLMRREGLEFPAALEQLARRAGVELKPRTQEDEQQDQLRTRLLDVNAAAAVFFQHMLVKSRKGETARAYVAKRQIDEPTVEAFQIGYAPDDWSALLAYLSDRKGFEPEEIAAAGLAIQRESGGYYDRFRERLMFPIRDAKGAVIAFGGRALGDGQPKYMNSPETPLFSKSTILYGLDLARDVIRAGDAAVIVEGYVDVVIAHQYGFRNVVAPLGTALTGEHVGALKKLAKRIYLALDADAAGIRATLKGVQTLRDHLDSHAVPVPTPQGIIRWERELDAEIKIIALPEGKDPDEVIQANPDQWRAAVAMAQPVMDFYITALTANLDMGSGKGKAEAVKQLAPIVAQIASPVEQAHYIQQIARLVQVEEHVVRAAIPSARASLAPTQRTTKAPAPVPARFDGAPTQEDYLLGWLIRYPAARTAVQEKLVCDLEPFPIVGEVITGALLELFEQVENRAVWQTWLAQADTPLAQWYAGLDETLRAKAEWALRLDLPETQSYRYVNNALECATIFQLRVARRWHDRLKAQIPEAEVVEMVELLERLKHVQDYINALSAPRRISAYADLHNQRTW